MVEEFPYIAHILVIDDDDRLRELLQKYLTKEKFLVSVASDAIQAEEILESLQFDLIIVDKMMPQKNGVEFIKTLRKNDNQTPIIMLTAMGDIDSKIEGLSIGADDYIAKPFDAKELTLRIFNILKRTNAFNSDKNSFYFSNYEYNLKTGMLKQDNQTIKLTDIEKKLLEYFISKPTEIISREELALLLNLKDERGVDVAITRLRRKIESNIKTPECILTVRNKGYKFII
jgi:two-component system phosphate regulon response regulator OmpR